MKIILLNILFGVFLAPILLFLGALILENYREKKGLSKLPPKLVSLIILLCSLVSWVIAGINITTYLLRN